MTWLTQLCIKADISHEQFVVLLPDRVSLIVTFYNNTLHVIGKDKFRYTHIQKGMYHTYEQILLLCVGKEFYIPLPTAMADHCKACNLILITVLCLYFHEAPVHLISFARSSLITPSTVSLRGYDLAFGRYKIAMSRYIILYNCKPACIPVFF